MTGPYSPAGDLAEVLAGVCSHQSPLLMRAAAARLRDGLGVDPAQQAMSLPWLDAIERWLAGRDAE